MRIDEQTFLRYWSGTSMIPALLMWGMRHGTFAPDGKPMTVDQIAADTGWTRQQVYDMLAVADRMIVKREDDNESTHKPWPTGR